MTTYEVKSENMDPQPTAVDSATLAPEEIGSWLAKVYGTVARVVAARGDGPAGPPFARYHRLPDGELAVEAGFPVKTQIECSDQVRPSELSGGPVATTIHVGPYAEMAPAYEALSSWISAHGGEPEGDPWEIYLSEPTGDPKTWRTEVVQPYHLAQAA